MLCQWIDSTVSPWVYGSIEACSDSTLEIPVGPQTIMAFDIAPTRRSGALVMGQMKDGKIAVGLAQLWYSDIAIDEMKMASDINEWARKYHPIIPQHLLFHQWQPLRRESKPRCLASAGSQVSAQQ